MATKNKTPKKKTAAKKSAASKKVTQLNAAKRSKAKKSAPKKAPAKKSATAPSKSATVISLAQARENRPSKIDWANLITPIDDRVLVELVKPEEKTAGGLYIPDVAQKKSNNAKVVAVGPGKRDKKGRRRPLDVQVGERILYAEYAGNSLKLEGVNLLLLKESDILGVIEP